MGSSDLTNGRITHLRRQVGDSSSPSEFLQNLRRVEQGERFATVVGAVHDAGVRQRSAGVFVAVVAVDESQSGAWEVDQPTTAAGSGGHVAGNADRERARSG